jgi:hypothetical protein
VIVIRDEPVNVSGSVENVKASSIVADELSLKVDISHLCQMECLIEELVLRNIAEIAYAQQALKKMQVSAAYAYKFHRISSSKDF